MGLTLLYITGLIIIAILLFVPFRFSGDVPANKLIIFAHRGASSVAPENTMPAIEKAIAAGADYIEIDVQLSKDRQVVLMHDRSVKRTTDGEGKISELDWTYLRTLDAGCWFDKKYTGTRIPLLEEVIQNVNSRAKLLIEIKAGNEMNGIEKELIGSIKKYDAESWCEVQSFSDNILENIHRECPGIRLHKLFILKLRFLPIIFDGSFSSFSYEKYEYVYAFNIHRLFGTHPLLKDIHDHKKKANAWGCISESSCKAYKMDGWDGIITDWPDRYDKHTK